MKIKILQNIAGAADGITIVHYKVGEIADVPEKLAATFLKEGFAEILFEKMEHETPENKMEKIPSDKSITSGKSKK